MSVCLISTLVISDEISIGRSFRGGFCENSHRSGLDWPAISPHPANAGTYCIEVDVVNGIIYILQDGQKKRAQIDRCGEYIRVVIEGKKRNAARLIYEHTHGPIPPWLVVDHINRNPADNRIENLRLVTTKQNNENRLGAQRNNKIGLKGVSCASGTHKYRAQIKHNGKKIHLGLFESPIDAYAAYCRAASELHTCNPNGDM